jgi:hypothetical protein
VGTKNTWTTTSFHRTRPSSDTMLQEPSMREDISRNKDTHCSRFLQPYILRNSLVSCLLFRSIQGHSSIMSTKQFSDLHLLVLVTSRVPNLRSRRCSFSPSTAPRDYLPENSGSSLLTTALIIMSSTTGRTTQGFCISFLYSGTSNICLYKDAPQTPNYGSAVASAFH